MALVRTQVETLMSGKVPMCDLVLSTELQALEKYKNKTEAVKLALRMAQVFAVPACALAAMLQH